MTSVENGVGLMAEGLTVLRGGRRVLESCSIAFRAGAVHAVVGHNGAGKTTLFETLFGFLAPQDGTIRLGTAGLRQSDVAYMPTELELYLGLTGREVLALFARGSIEPVALREAAALDVPVDDAIDSYSYGTRRKLALVGVMSLRRPVLLLDEPFEALDVVSRRIVRHLLRRAAEDGRIVIFSSHELETLESFCDTVSVLQGGSVQGTYPAQPMAELEARLVREVDRRVRVLGSES